MKRFLPLILLVFVLVGCSPTFPLVMDTRTATPVEPTATVALTPVVTATAAITATPAIDPTPCNIKGTAASHLFHMPGTLTYKRTQVIAARGDRWFCSEQEAISAGFTRAKK